MRHQHLIYISFVKKIVIFFLPPPNNLFQIDLSGYVYSQNRHQSRFRALKTLKHDRLYELKAREQPTAYHKICIKPHILKQTIVYTTNRIGQY